MTNKHSHNPSTDLIHKRVSIISVVLGMVVFIISSPNIVFSQLNENCTVSVLNRTVKVKPDGSWILPNVPSTIGQVRARKVCVMGGITRAGQSDFFTIPTDGSVDVPEIPLNAFSPIPDTLTLTTPNTVLTLDGATTQLTVTATFGDGSTADVTSMSAGTNYTVSNPTIATVSTDGLVTAATSGTVVMTAMNEGAVGFIQLQVVLSGDTDGDGIFDDTELANGLDPNNPVDALEDFDGDGLTNKEEIVDFGTNIQSPDSDGDGFTDGDEIASGTDPNDPNDFLYDDFSEERIDSTKWENLELLRRLSGGVLQSTFAQFGSDDGNGLDVLNPTTVENFEVDVSITEVDNVEANPLAGLAGAFYNDGTPGGGATGDIIAAVGIGHNGTNLGGAFVIGRCEDFECDDFTILLIDDTTFGLVGLGETHHVSVTWDGSMFTFGFDSQESTLDPANLAPIVAPPGDPFMSVGTFVLVEDETNPNNGAFIAANLDNVIVNNLPYDDFESGTLDPSKWESFEVTRRVNNGRFESAVTSSGDEADALLNFPNPATVDNFQADVIVTAVNEAGGTLLAQLTGNFFNAVASGAGAAGDVFAGVGITHNTTQLVGVSFVFQCDNPDCAAVTVLHLDDTTFGQVVLGEKHRLAIDWDGTQFTFTFDEQVVTFDHSIVAPFMRPARFPSKSIGTAVTAGASSAANGSISATFDNVVVR